MTDLSHLSDAELLALHNQTTGTDLSHLSDDDLMKAYAASNDNSKAGPEDGHDFYPSLEGGISAMGGQIKDAALGGMHAVLHPVATAHEIGASLGSSPSEYASGAYRALRSVPFLGSAVTGLVGNVKALGAMGSTALSGGSAEEVGQAAIDSQKADQKAQAAEDAVHASAHPLTDFLQRSAGLAGLPEAAIPQTGMIAVDAFNRSLSSGNDTLTAMQDARNAAALFGLSIVGAKGVGTVARGAGKIVAREAGVSGKSIGRYLENPDAVNEAAQYVKDPESLKNLVDAKVAAVADSADEGVGTATRELDTARENLASRQAALSSAKESVPSGPPISLGSEIPEHLDTQGAKLADLSNQAFDILGDEGKDFTIGKLSGAVSQKMNDLKIGGVEPSVGPDAAAYQALGQFKDMIEDIGQKQVGSPNRPVARSDIKIPASVVKQLIQTLDSVSKGAYEKNAGALGPEAAVNFAGVRGKFNQLLRDASDDYAAKMDELAPMVRLTSDMSKVFGNEPSALNALNAAADPSSPRGYLARQLLKRYDEANGTDFGARVSDYFDKPQAAVDEAGTGLGEAQTSLADKKAAVEQMLNDKKNALANVNKIGPNSTETTLKSIQGGRNIEARKQLEALDPDLAQTVQDAGVARQFSKDTTNGSRKAVTFGALGGAIGHTIAGPVGGWLGAGAGSALGALADKYGGVAVKAALDAGIKVDRLASTPYIGPVMQAVAKGPQALAIYHYIHSQNDQKYQELNRGGE